jgi:RND family efflux transporter MFP subunit
MTRRVLVVVCGLAGMVVIAGGLWFASVSGKPAAAGPESAVRVETVPVTRADLKRVSDVTEGELLPYESTDLKAKISGYVREMHVDYGDRVRKDQVLAVLRVPEMDKELEQKIALVKRAEEAIKQAQEAVKAAEAGFRSAQAKASEAEAGRLRARGDYDRWKIQYEKAEDLVRRQLIDTQTRDQTLNDFKSAEAALAEVEAKVVSAQAAKDESKANWDKAQQDVRVAEANLRVARADQGELEALLEYAKIVAPYDGVVTKRYLHTGAFLNTHAGEQPLFTVLRTDKLRLVTDVSERDVRYLDKRDKVHLDLDAYPGTKFEWPITRLAPVLGDGKKVRVEVEIENRDGKLYPGMYGHASVILEEKPQALTVPATCLSTDDKGTFVWLVEDGKARPVRVTIGLNDGKRAEITSGLSATAQVICSGKEGIQEGQPVLAKEAGAPAAK